MRDGRLHPLPSPSIFGIPIDVDLAPRRPALLPPEARDHLAAGDGRARDGALELGDTHRTTSPWRASSAGSSVPRPSASSRSRCSAASMPVTSRNFDPGSRAPARRRGRRGPSVPGAAARRGPGDGLFKALRGGMGELVYGDRKPAAGRQRARADSCAARVSFARTGVAGRDRRRERSRRARSSSQRRRTRPRDCSPPPTPPLAALCAEVPYVSTVERGARVAAQRASSIRWPAAASSSRASTANCASPPARGCRRSGRTARGRAWCCCARFSAARRIPAPSTFPMTRSSTSRRATSPPVLAHHGRAAPRPRAALAARRRAAQRRTCRSAGARRTSGSTALPGLFVAGSGFHSIGVPDCVADGRAAAARAAAFVAIR